MSDLECMGYSIGVKLQHEFATDDYWRPVNPMTNDHILISKQTGKVLARMKINKYKSK